MAEEKRNLIFVGQNINVIHEGDQVRVGGDIVRRKTSVRAAEIEQVTVSNEELPLPQHLAYEQPGQPNFQNLFGEIFFPETPSTISPATPSPSSKPPYDVTAGVMTMGMRDGTTFFAKERARQLMEDSKYREAIFLLDQMHSSHGQRMMLSECFLREKMWSKANKCIGALKTLVETSLPRPNPSDVLEVADDYLAKSLYVRALILLPCASKLYMLDSKAADAIHGITHCCVRCSVSIAEMAAQGGRMRTIAANVGIESIQEMLSQLHCISGIGEDKKTKGEAYCLINVGKSYQAIGKHDQALSTFQTGMDKMKNQFGEASCSKYQVFGHLLSSFGAVEMELGNYRQSEHWFAEALNAYGAAQDWKSEKQKKAAIDENRGRLKAARNKRRKR